MKTIQINTCTQEELEWLPGVGAKTAEKIVKARPIEAETDLERLVPPSAWLKIQDADVKFAFGMDGEEPAEALPEAELAANLEQLTGLLDLGHLSEEEAAAFKKRWLEQSLQLAKATKRIPVISESPLILLQEPEPLTLRRVLPGQPLKTGVGAKYLCVWNVRWGPDGAAYHPRDEPVQVEIEEKLKAYNIGIQYAHYKASVRVQTNSYGPIPLVLFEIVKETEDAKAETEGDHQGNGERD